MDHEDEWTGFALESPEMPESWQKVLSWTMAVGLFMVAALGVWYGLGLVVG